MKRIIVVAALSLVLSCLVAAQLDGRIVEGSSQQSTATTAALLTTSPTQTEGARRVRFLPGRSSAVVQGIVGSDDTITYLIGARAGQTMDLDISRGAAFRLFTPSGEPLQGGRGVSGATEELETGDYRVEVEKRSSRARVAYRLRIVIR